MRQLGSTDLKRLHRAWNRRTTGRLALLLEGVQSPFNVGGIVRTAAALRVDTLFLAEGTTGVAHPQARRLSMGTERYLQVSDLGSGPNAVSAAHSAGYLVVALELTDQAVPLHELVVVGDVCIVLGNEDHGIKRETLSVVDAVAYIPQLGRVGSLNVGAAAAIVLYELRRRAWTANE